MIEPEIGYFSIRRQCKSLELCRGSYYYQPQLESTLNLALMRIIDEYYTQHPFYGSPRMTKYLNRLGYPINHKRIERLMQIMGIQAIYPRRRTTVKNCDHPVYPYLLRGLKIEVPDQVWCSDITFIPMHQGYLYLVAIMDWYSRYVLAWALSNTLDSNFCITALKTALKESQPQIFNTDQGSQFTCLSFIQILSNNQVQISMDGRGRVYDNIFIERLWRSLKYEEIYMKEYQSGTDVYHSLNKYFCFYNYERLHQSLGYLTPYEVYQRTR